MVNRPSCGWLLNVSKQITPAVSNLIMATWSCMTNLGRRFIGFCVFLSTWQMMLLTVISSATEWMWHTAL